MSEELAHDAHLRAALRHAPDHALAPPSGLSQTILTAARQVHLPVRASAAPPPVRMHPAGGRPLSLWLQRLFAPRWAGAWAAGLVAALGLGLWLDLGMGPVLDRPETVATRDSAQQTQTPSNAEGGERTPSSPGNAAADSARVAALAKVQPPTPAEQPAPPTATADATRPAPRQRTDEHSDALRREVDELSQRREAVAPRPAEKAARRAEATTAEAAMQGRVAAAPESKFSEPAVGASAAAAAPPAPTVAQANAPPRATALEMHQGAVQRDARKAELGEALPAASPAFTLLRRAQAELAAGSVRWTWAAPGVPTMAPFDDAAQAWLARVVQLARGRWVDVRERGESLDALEVRWWRDGWPHATLRIEAEGLRWIEPNGRIRYAPLDAATLQRVRTF